MSNGDDVLDNWEEIDEAGIQNLKSSSASSATCERITNSLYQHTTTAISTSALNSSTSSTRPIQMKLLQRSTATPESAITTSSSKPIPKSPLDDMSATFQPVMMVLHKPQDEYQSANYTPPIANQTVKILRRPTQSSEPRNNGIRPKQPIKTLQQREQEYAEARLRILGSAKNPEDDEQKESTTTTTSVTTSTTNSTPSTPTVTAAALSNNSIMNMATTTKINSPKTQGSANQYNNHYNQQLQLQQQQQQQYHQNFQQQQQQQQQNYFYNQQQQQQQPQSPAYNNNRTYNMNPLLGLGPMGAIGQPAQYQATALSSPQTQQQQQHLKYQQYHQKSPQQQHKTQQQQQQQQQQLQTWSPVVGGSVSSSSVRQQQNETILRLPRGPDGTIGFQMRR